jgi:hypothetical protein
MKRQYQKKTILAKEFYLKTRAKSSLQKRIRLSMIKTKNFQTEYLKKFKKKFNLQRNTKKSEIDFYQHSE